jgi:hypothetical protein
MACTGIKDCADGITLVEGVGVGVKCVTESHTLALADPEEVFDHLNLSRFS